MKKRADLNILAPFGQHVENRTIQLRFRLGEPLPYIYKYIYIDIYMMDRVWAMDLKGLIGSIGLFLGLMEVRIGLV